MFMSMIGGIDIGSSAIPFRVSGRELCALHGVA